MNEYFYEHAHYGALKANEVIEATGEHPSSIQRRYLIYAEMRHYYQASTYAQDDGGGRTDFTYRQIWRLIPTLNNAGKSS